MPDQSGNLGAGEEAARKLLEGADPTLLPRDELLAAVDELAKLRTVQAADALSRLTQPKDIAKAARRALFRLQTQGIRPAVSSQPQPAAQASAAEPPRMKLLEARVSSYDPRGTRAVSILAEKPFTGLLNLFAIGSDVDGLLDADLASTTKKAFYTRLENFTRQYGFIEFVPVAAEYANQVVYQCAAKNEQSGQALPQDFAMWKSFGAEPPDPPLDPPILSELQVEDVRSSVPLEETKELAVTEFEAWVFEEDRLKEHLARLETARGGPLVVSQSAQHDREKAIIDEATDELFRDDELVRAKQRLQETAHFLLQKGQQDAARKCLRAALEVDVLPPHEQPFLRGIVSKSVDVLSHEDHDHEAEERERSERKVTRTESGIVLPA